MVQVTVLLIRPSKRITELSRIRHVLLESDKLVYFFINKTPRQRPVSSFLSSDLDTLLPALPGLEHLPACKMPPEFYSQFSKAQTTAINMESDILLPLSPTVLFHNKPNITGANLNIDSRQSSIWEPGASLCPRSASPTAFASKPELRLSSCQRNSSGGAGEISTRSK